LTNRFHAKAQSEIHAKIAQLNFETFAFLSVFFARKISFGVLTKDLKNQQARFTAYH
jgi:hypothetical protein